MLQSGRMAAKHRGCVKTRNRAHAQENYPGFECVNLTYQNIVCENLAGANRVPPNFTGDEFSHSLRTNRTCAVAANAHAEIACMRSIARMPAQHISPNRSFKPTDPG